MKNLSAYTKPQNCTDYNDCQAGIDELNEYFENCARQKKQGLYTAYSRYNKLVEKQKKFTNLNFK